MGAVVESLLWGFSISILRTRSSCRERGQAELEMWAQGVVVVGQAGVLAEVGLIRYFGGSCPPYRYSSRTCGTRIEGDLLRLTTIIA